MRKKYKIGVYLRTATEDQIIEAPSRVIDLQYKNILQFVLQYDLGEIVSIHDDIGSGVCGELPGYQQLLRRVRCQDIDLVVVTDLNRISRNAVFTADFLVELERYQCAFVSVKERFASGKIDPSFNQMMEVQV